MVLSSIFLDSQATISYDGKHVVALDEDQNLLFFEPPTLSLVRGQQIKIKVPQSDKNKKEKFTTVANPSPDTWFICSTIFDGSEDDEDDQYSTKVYMMKDDPRLKKLEDISIALFKSCFTTYNVHQPDGFFRFLYVPEIEAYFVSMSCSEEISVILSEEGQKSNISLLYNEF